jgi:hypothetical protein
LKNSIDPISDDQLNQTNVTVTGTTGDGSYNVWVNGIEAYYTDDAGDWAATNVPVSSTGTATVSVEAWTDLSHVIASQTLYQAQPARVELMSYSAHVSAAGEGMFGPYSTKDDDNWTFLAGGSEVGFGNEILQSGWTNYGTWAISFAAGEGGYYPNYSEASVILGEWQNISISSQWSSGYENDHTQTRVMIQPPGQQSVGQSTLYLVMAQVINKDTGLQLAASAVRFVNQLAGTATEDVTDDGGSVWTEAVVSGAAGAQTEVTPQAAGNISFAAMKLSKLVYISVDDNGNVPSGFRNNISLIQSKLHSELSDSVFYDLTIPTDVQIKVVITNTAPSKLGWDSGAKQTYYSRVNFDWNNLTFNNNFSNNDYKGTVGINLNWFQNQNVDVNTSVTAQGWVNILAHEDIWGNVAVKGDCIFFCTDYEISSHAQSYGDSNPFTVLPDSRLTILKGCGLKSN